MGVVFGGQITQNSKRKTSKANVWAFYQDRQSTYIQVRVSFVKLVDRILVLIT